MSKGDKATRKCGKCGRLIEVCAGCDEPGCVAAVCGDCLRTVLGQSIPQPHAHGG